MTNDNDVLLLLSSQNNGTYGVYIDSKGYKTLTPQTGNYTAKYTEPSVCNSQYGLLAGKDPKKVIFPNCSKASGHDDPYTDGAFCYAFYSCPSLTSISFPVLREATGGNDEGAFQDAFENNPSLTSISFPVLREATGGDRHGAFQYAFRKNPSLTSVSFPVLRKATGGTNYSIPKTYGAFHAAFIKCTSLTSVSFPSLTIVNEVTDENKGATFYHAFSNCSWSLKVHFKKSMKGTVGLDYETMGLRSSSQVVFDLP